MLPKEVETMSTPVISFSKHRILEDDMEITARERSHSFKDSMKNSVPSVARLSPKPHRKHRSHSHHRSHHHESRSPRGSPRGSPTAQRKSNLLHVNDSDRHGNMLRQRSYSDTQIATSVPAEADAHLKSAIVSSPLLRRPLYSRQKSPLDDTSGTSTEDDDEVEGICITVKKHDDDFIDGVDTTISREVLGDKGGVTLAPYKGTTTRRKEEVVAEVNDNSRKSRKMRTLKMIDELVEQCTVNYRNIELDIESEFTQLFRALEARKTELLDEAKNIRDSRLESLQESKKKCLSCKSVMRLKKMSPSSLVDAESGSGDSSRRSSGEHDVCLQSNGILEPWKSTQEENGNVDMEKVAKKLNEGEEVFSEILQEGNVSFNFHEECIEMFSSVGELKCNLSSPQFSFVKGLQHGIALSSESVRFEVHTRNLHNELSFNAKDDIKCDIYNFDDGEYNEITNHVSLQRCLSNGRVIAPNSPHTPLLHKFYTYVFTPKQLGRHNIRVSVNNVEIKTSPILFTVYPKVDLTFDLKSPEEKKEIAPSLLNEGCIHVNALDKRRQLTMKRRQSSEDGDWVEDNWIVQKGDKSSLLRCITDVPSYIYALPSVKGFCAWKIRVTSACESVNISVGVGTHSGIPDIDEHFSCDFAITPAKTEKKRSSGGPRMQVRRTSSFTRISVTYNVLVDTEECLVRVICEQKDEDKTVTINKKLSEQFELYPFVSMVHRHDECGKQICPKPQITLL